MRLIITSILITPLLASKADSQFRLSPSETFAEEFDFFSYEEYDEALPLFLSLLRRDESDSHLQYLTGVCYLNIEGQKQRALQYLERASGSISIEHRTGVFEERTVPVDCFYYLGSDGMACPVSLSYDGHELYLYQYDGLSNTNLYVSRFTENRWPAMERVHISVSFHQIEETTPKAGDTTEELNCCLRVYQDI